ncbi:hypothetical protein MBRA_05699 [Methylobacterium brachiatum]|jgi:hypothetical protein|nr:hypothetical protein MBRA_05699 [Methylobacterium brachiatum]
MGRYPFPAKEMELAPPPVPFTGRLGKWQANLREPIRNGDRNAGGVKAVMKLSEHGDRNSAAK